MTVSKGTENRREARKKPAMTLKEKRAAKHAKRDARDTPLVGRMGR